MRPSLDTALPMGYTAVAFPGWGLKEAISQLPNGRVHGGKGLLGGAEKRRLALDGPQPKRSDGVALGRGAQRLSMGRPTEGGHHGAR